jgi:hypothetical protein
MDLGIDQKEVADQVSWRAMGWRQPGQRGKCLNGGVRRKLDTSRDRVVGNLVLLMPGSTTVALRMGSVAQETHIYSPGDTESAPRYAGPRRPMDAGW